MFGGSGEGGWDVRGVRCLGVKSSGSWGVWRGLGWGIWGFKGGVGLNIPCSSFQCFQ